MSTNVSKPKQEKKRAVKQFVVFTILLCVALSPLAADGGITELDTWGQNVLNLFTSTWVKALLMVALIVEAIGVVFAGQQGGGGQMIKKFVPWIVGTIILLSATSICTYFIGDKLNFTIS